ncbi:MAG: hypothetical protein IOC90_13880 [Methylocystis sp.]|jgi:hypothetical protein|nr:hypothetical protein [Methylocystis sp.]MCA3583402.1 hypothetical protein [Methylocystis sp.]MCA3589103.1 hypothetical protein [Methylocystis sp.]MCA3591921.1 hypothetical protein [Methylocystis sp.]
MSDQHRPDPRPRVASAQDAEAVVNAAIDALDVIEPVIAEETALLRDGKMKAALDVAERKHPAAQAYQRALEDLKANAIALGRYNPPSLALLRKRHESFSELMSLNMAVLGTAKTVSESIIRELANEVGQARSPQGYGAYGQPGGGYRIPAAPLAVSKTL